MPKNTSLSREVTIFLDNEKHPLRKEIEELRVQILESGKKLTENIKWNGPNYSDEGQDRITMKIHPPTKIQLIFHRGAKVQAQPATKLIADTSGLLTWKENDRAFAMFLNLEEIQAAKKSLSVIVREWLKACK